MRRWRFAKRILSPAKPFPFPVEEAELLQIPNPDHDVQQIPTRWQQKEKRERETVSPLELDYEMDFFLAKNTKRRKELDFTNPPQQFVKVISLKMVFDFNDALREEFKSILIYI